MKRDPIYDHLEEAANDWSKAAYKMNAMRAEELNLPPPASVDIGSLAAASAAVSAKRSADALKLIAKHLAPGISVDFAGEIRAEVMRAVREATGMDILKVQYGDDIEPGPGHPSKAESDWLKPDDKRLHSYTLSTPIEVRWRDPIDVPDRMCLGDAIEWSTAHFSPDRKLKASIAEWRPL